MINRMFAAVFAPKYPRRYIGRHRAPEAVPALRSTGIPLPAAIPDQRAN